MTSKAHWSAFVMLADSPNWRWAAARVAPIAMLSVALVTLGSVVGPPPHWMPPDVPDVTVVKALIRWDAGWYGEIAQNGYWIKPGQQSPVAFFPMYPMVIRAVSWLGIDRWVAAVLVSFVCSVTALILFSQWARLRAPARSSQLAFWLLVLYPFAEYLYGVAYSDALFLLLAVGAFLALEKERPVLSALLGALACACRPVAPAVVVGLLVRSLEKRKGKGEALEFADFVPALAGLGLVAFMAYLQWRFDDALAFAHVQGVPGWDQPPGWRSWLKVEWFKTLFPSVAPLVAIRLGGHALATVIALALVVPTFKKLGWGYGTYTLIAMGIPAISSKDFQGLGRYTIAAFPLFLTLALLLESRTPRLRRVVLFAFGLTLAALAIGLGAGGYVA